jgi:hypothetical protein
MYIKDKERVFKCILLYSCIVPGNFMKIHKRMETNKL